MRISIFRKNKEINFVMADSSGSEEFDDEEAFDICTKIKGT